MFLHMCVCQQEGCLLRGVPGPRGCLIPGVPGPRGSHGGSAGPAGGSALGGCLVGGRVCSRGVCWGVPGSGGLLLGMGIPACAEADPPPAGETATAADGMHPTGMHSFSNFFVYAKKIASMGVSLEPFLNECRC